MRKATYRIPRAEGDGEDAELTVTQVGGSVDDNVRRWEGQFKEGEKAKTMSRKVGELAVTVVELEGTFTGGGMPGMAPGEPKAGWALLAAIADTAGGAHFFKMTGPKKTVQAARAELEELCASFQPK
jgi:hypothetical protein